MRWFAVALAAIMLAGPLASELRAQDPTHFYQDNCAPCHTIGEGPMGGPDLEGVTARRDREWLIQFLLDPDAFADDPVVKQMIAEAGGMEMPATEGLTRELADAMLSLIDQWSGMPPSPATTARSATRDDVEAGRALFLGHTRFAAGGAPCVACHAGGDLRASQAGRLAVDLARIHERLGGHRGVSAWVASPPGPMMRALYRPAPLTPDEAHAVAAFLALDGDQTQPPAAALAPFVLAGTAGGLLFLGIIGVVWARRFRSVRQPLVARARHSQLGPRHAPGAGGMR